MHSYYLLVSYLLGGCRILQVEPQTTTVSHPIKHSLPRDSLVSLFGSDVSGRCTNISEGIEGDGTAICDGTSVLNDGIVPTPNSISDDTQSQWAAQLLTMNRTSSGVANIPLSFQVGSDTNVHDRLELVVFNCPQFGIHAPAVEIFVDTSFRPETEGFQFSQASVVLQSTSCDHLLKFCIKFGARLSTLYYTISFPYQNDSNYVFLGEVTFLNADDDVPCDPGAPEIIVNTTIPTPVVPLTDLVTSTTQQMERTTTSMDTLNKTVTEGERDNTTELESDGTTTLNSPHLSTQDTTHQATDRVSSQHSAATVIAIIISTALTLSLVTLFVAIMAALAKQRRQKVHENRQNVLNLRPSDGQEEEQSGNEENCSSLCLDHPENQGQETSNNGAQTKNDEFQNTNPQIDVSKPTLSNLLKMECKNEKGGVDEYRLKAEIVLKWKEFGDLVIPREQIDKWAAEDSNMQPDDCCEAMLSYWLDNPPPGYPVTWESLYELLELCDLGQVACNLKRAVNKATKV